jgi:ADP-dependent NAD(P)H-hydrate dehydratase / NAD(P)H-hydrate epimerase
LELLDHVDFRDGTCDNQRTMQRLFLSEAGEPVSSVTASEAMQLIRMSEMTGAPGLAEMVESGGRSAYDMVQRILKEETGPVVVVAGPGYTGAIGLSLARHLANHGVPVEVHLPSNPRRTENDKQLAGLRRTGVMIAEHIRDLVHEPVLIVEAMVGASGPAVAEEDLIRVCRWIRERKSASSRVLSLETPAGVDATTGVATEWAVIADYTLCVGFPKTGLQRENCGRCSVADVGVPPETYRKTAIIAYPCVFTDSFILDLQALV